MQDAQDVMDMLVKVQNEQGDMEPDDPQVCVRVYVGGDKVFPQLSHLVEDLVHPMLQHLCMLCMNQYM